jgi:hypothetical protein
VPETANDSKDPEQWNLDQCEELTDDERRQLERYRTRTRTFADRSDGFLAATAESDKQVDDHDANTMLNAWNAAWKELRDWHQIMNGERAAGGDSQDRNPVSQVLIKEHGAITALSNRLGGQI